MPKADDGDEGHRATDRESAVDRTGIGVTPDAPCDQRDDGGEHPGQRTEHRNGNHGGPSNEPGIHAEPHPGDEQQCGGKHDQAQAVATVGWIEIPSTPPDTARHGADELGKRPPEGGEHATDRKHHAGERTRARG